MQIDTPLCSAKRLDEISSELQSLLGNNASNVDNSTNLVEELEVRLSQYSINQTKNDANKEETSI